ncbi:MAG: phosphate regulon transcriptional regulator PhoB [Gammaproteobacteria bacterium]|nr:phosphate regulon transcriptional regulator PhoB [Gammaproteobacteria bacterium]
MNGKRILLVEDEPAIREMVTFALGQSGYVIDEAEDSRTAEAKMSEHLPDLILLDWMLPNVSGLELLRRWKRNESTQEIPVIMLTAKVEERDRVDGLDSGADDYILKPFSVKELSARIRAVLRRSSGAIEDQVSVGPIKLDSKAHRVHVHEEVINLGPTEFRLLEFFMTHPDRVYSRAQLLDYVWGRNMYVEERTVDVHIVRLRKLLKPLDCAHMIQTVRGYGYRLSVSK